MSRFAQPIISLWSVMRSAVVERMGEHEVRWRALGALFAAGGLLSLSAALLPSDEARNPGAVLVLGAVSLVAGVTMMGLPRLLPKGDRWVSFSLAFGTALISGAVFLDQDASTPLALLYVWVAFDSFFFLPRRAALGQLLLASAAYAAVLLAIPHDPAAGARWLMTMGTVVVVGGLADVLRERSDRLIRKLSTAASTDPLTGLWNRRGFERRMEAELAQAERSGEPVSLLVGDLDHFKLINDLFGHGQGDAVLQQFGELLQASLRQGDDAARVGGEEFAVILPGCDQHEAHVLAERLRRRVREEFARGTEPLSISIGVASSPAHGRTPAELLHNADRALYLAKHLGRDRSVVFSRNLDSPLGREDVPVAREQLSAVLVLAETLDLRDGGTAAHSQTVARYAEAIARQLELEPACVERIRLAGLLHDLGKLGVPDAILQKPSSLTDEEWAEMRKHPELGARILSSANLDDVAEWVLAHHERPDGRGYPAGLHAEAIPVQARILAVADAFEAMTSDRVYRPGMPLAAAVEELHRGTGSQFCPEVVAAFIATVPTAETELDRPDRTPAAA